MLRAGGAGGRRRAASRRSPQAAEQAVPGDIDDDMAIVVVRTSAGDLAVLGGQFPGRADQGVGGPADGAETFMRWGMEPEQAELACLLVSEVVTNVVLHAAASPSPRPSSLGAGRPAAGGWSARCGRVTRRAARTTRRTASRRPPAGGKEFTLRLRRGGPRSGSRYSTPTCGCRGSAARARPTRAAAACTWSTSCHPVGVTADHGRQGRLVRDPDRRGGSRPRALTAVAGARPGQEWLSSPSNPRTTTAKTAMMTIQVRPVTPSPIRRRTAGRRRTERRGRPARSARRHDASRAGLAVLRA